MTDTKRNYKPYFKNQAQNSILVDYDYISYLNSCYFILAVILLDFFLLYKDFYFK